MRHDVDGRDGDTDCCQDEGGCGSPDPPGAWEFAYDGEEDDDRDGAEDRADQERFDFIAHPRAEGLRGEAVFVLADVAFVELKRKAEERCDDEVLSPVDEGLQPAEAGDAYGEVAHFCGPAKVEQEQHDRGGVEEIPEDEPVAAFEVGVGAGFGSGRHHGHVSFGGGVGVEVIGGLGGGRDPGDVDRGLNDGLGVGYAWSDRCQHYDEQKKVEDKGAQVPLHGGCLFPDGKQYALCTGFVQWVRAERFVQETWSGIPLPHKYDKV